MSLLNWEQKNSISDTVPHNTFHQRRAYEDFLYSSVALCVRLFFSAGQLERYG
jgi:hypothetical protein